MNLSTLDNVLWAASFAANAALLLVLIWKKRWREFPVLTTWMTFDVLLTIALFGIYRLGSSHLYADVYWLSAIVDFLLQIGVVLEMARIVLRPTGTWLRDARTRFVAFGSLGALVAAAIAVLIHPAAPTPLDAWELRGNLFASIIVCELFLAMMMSANRLGLQWGNHVMGLGRGLTAWAMVTFSVDALHGVLVSERVLSTLDHVQTIVWTGAVVYWSVIFWLPEPERLPLSPGMRKYLIDLHHRVQYDLDKVRSSPNP
jgi:hypothetical protein